VDEVKDVKDKAEALRLYARQANDRDLECWTAEIKLRAVRRIGELSAALEKVVTTGGGNVGIPASGKPKAQVLDAAGISTSTAHRYEKVAALPRESAAPADRAADREADSGGTCPGSQHWRGG